MKRRRSRHALPSRVVLRITLVLALSVAAGIAGVVRLSGEPGGRAAALPPRSLVEPSPTVLAPSTDTSVPQWPAFARAGGVTLYLPVAHPVGVLYHEASFHDALRLRPLGHLVRNANHWGFKRLPRTSGPGYIVMSSRGRGTPATSAADVVIPAHTAVRSPVTGRVLDVHPYRLYCTYPDTRVTIRPDGGWPMKVHLIHLARVRVKPGDRVFATLSVIGYPRVFPFGSQVDDYLRGGNPHVHIEITKPAATPKTC